MPTNSVNPLTYQGASDLSAQLQESGTFNYNLIGNITAVTKGNPTSATTLMSASIPAGLLILPGTGLSFFGGGTYSCGVSSTLVFTVNFGAVALATITTASQTNTATTLGWLIEGTLLGDGGQNGSASILWGRTKLTFEAGSTTAAAASVFLDTNTSALTAVNMTVANTFNIQANFGSSNGSNTITQNFLQVVKQS